MDEPDPVRTTAAALLSGISGTVTPDIGFAPPRKASHWRRRCDVHGVHGSRGVPDKTRATGSNSRIANPGFPRRARVVSPPPAIKPPDGVTLVRDAPCLTYLRLSRVPVGPRLNSDATVKKDGMVRRRTFTPTQRKVDRAGNPSPVARRRVVNLFNVVF